MSLNAISLAPMQIDPYLSQYASCVAGERTPGLLAGAVHKVAWRFLYGITGISGLATSAAGLGMVYNGWHLLSLPSHEIRERTERVIFLEERGLTALALAILGAVITHFSVSMSQAAASREMACSIDHYIHRYLPRSVSSF